MAVTTEIAVGKRISYDQSSCTVRYIGPVEGTKAGTEWVGVEWDDPSRGKHDGCANGKRYFICKSTSSTAASFVRSSKHPDPTRSFVEAVKSKYADDNSSHPLGDQPIIVSGKVAEEVGFKKIHDQQSRLHELKIVHVDNFQIAIPEYEKDDPIETLCPSIIELNLSRNHLSFSDALYIASPERLTRLRSLKLNGNHFEAPDSYWEEGNFAQWDTPSQITDLHLEDVLLRWKTLCKILELFNTTISFSAALNQLNCLDTPLPTNTLRTLTLDYNDFTTLSDLAILRQCTSLENLRLKGNKIISIDHAPYVLPRTHQFGENITYVDLSYNAIDSWKFVDELDYCFPGLTSLRLAHNPIYDEKNSESGGNADANYMLTIARFANLKSFNFSSITAADRSNAEMFYLSRIARAIATVPESDETLVIAKHKRYTELCEQYGEPTIVRTTENTVNPGFLEARLIKFTFNLAADGKSEGTWKTTFSKEIPKSFDIYRVKGVVGRLFGLRPLSVRLIWETGEWDPVAGYEDEGDSNEDDEEGDKQAVSEDADSKKGRWMKREVEIEESTRLVGNCVDGLEAIVRVEIRL